MRALNDGFLGIITGFIEGFSDPKPYNEELHRSYDSDRVCLLASLGLGNRFGTSDPVENYCI